jgi:hypothetical protein
MKNKIIDCETFEYRIMFPQKILKMLDLKFLSRITKQDMGWKLENEIITIYIENLIQFNKISIEVSRIQQL